MPNKKLIENLGFIPKENSIGIFLKKYPSTSNYVIEVDFENQKFNFGNKIKSDTGTTQNFSQEEKLGCFRMCGSTA
jgi:type I restriction enzyme M protein